jgi:hypothetical protein
MECDCVTDLAFDQTLSGSASTTVSLDAVGTLESVGITFNYTLTGSSWPGDLLLGICSPSGACIQIGGYDVSLGYTIGGSLPASWNVAQTGLYTTTVDVSTLGITGEGLWEIELVNGYASSGAVLYDVDLVLNGVCEVNPVPGCTDETACNFAADANTDDGSCTYPAAANLDCFGDCLNDGDGDGVCDEDETAGCTDPDGCNYDASATDSTACDYPEAGFDCDGNPLSTCPEDLNGNGLVEIQDILMLLGDFGCQTPPCAGDLTGDGITSVADMLAMLSVFGTSCW